MDKKYILLKVDPKLHHRFKLACVRLGVSIQDTLLKFIKDFGKQEEE